GWRQWPVRQPRGRTQGGRGRRAYARERRAQAPLPAGPCTAEEADWMLSVTEAPRTSSSFASR
ncbi:MAG: hypothetical protein M3401_06325, partial [Actinomycetota bacterium]|nr:hypothetical protein [Actinomycetota bacterium]